MPRGPITQGGRSDWPAHGHVDTRPHARVPFVNWPQKQALFVGDVVATWPRVEAGWAGLTLDMRQNMKSVGKLSDFDSVEILGVGHGDPIPVGAIEVLKKLRDGKESGNGA